MKAVSVGGLDKKPLTFHQLTPEEAEAEGLPKGINTYWEHEGQRYTTPGEVISLVLKHAHAGTFDPGQLTSAKAVQSYYKTLRAVQIKGIIEHLKTLKYVYQSVEGAPDEYTEQARKSIDAQIKQYEDDAPFPDVGGVFQPTLEQAERIAGKHVIEQYFTDEQKKKLFG